MKATVLELPWPPSVNGYWRSHMGRQIISKRGREYRQAVIARCVGSEPMAGRLAVQIDLYPPDKRRRDVDNHAKAILDALTHGDVLEDDSQVDELVICRREIERGGRAVVEVKPMEGTNDE